MFTNIRNELNNREDELLFGSRQKFENKYFKEELIKESEKLPNKIKIALEKGKNIDKEYDKNKLNLLINDCINIENSIKDINSINESIKKCNDLIDITIFFNLDEKEINQFISNIKKLGSLENKNDLIKSSIINNDINKQIIITKWIKEKINKNEIKYELIFKMSENGSTSKDFHNYCNNKVPTLILIKTNKNRIFWRFTPLNWKNDGSYTYDVSNQTFIFSLNLMKKYDMINKKKSAIKLNGINYGPNFGDHDFSLGKNLKEGETYANNYCNYLSNNNLELTGGKGDNEKFATEEFEVYKVVF